MFCLHRRLHNIGRVCHSVFVFQSINFHVSREMAKPNDEKPICVFKTCRSFLFAFENISMSMSPIHEWMFKCHWFVQRKWIWKMSSFWRHKLEEKYWEWRQKDLKYVFSPCDGKTTTHFYQCSSVSDWQFCDGHHWIPSANLISKAMYFSPPIRWFPFQFCCPTRMIAVQEREKKHVW